jgi:diguanylate cyclase (GGDEF)-like protein
LSSVLAPVVGAGVLLFVFYFLGTGLISRENQETLTSEAKLMLVEVTRRESQLVGQELSNISRLTLTMQDDHERFFRSDQCTLPGPEPVFSTHPNGVYYKSRDNGGASLYYSSSTTMTDEAYAKARCSELMDPLLKSLVDDHPLVTQAYLNTWDDMNRLYPHMSDAPGQYGPVLDMESFNFYYLADQIHNPDRVPVWTEAYLDPAGQGWMISNVVPIYTDEGFLEGVSGLDVTLEVLVARLLDIRLPWEAGVIIAGQGEHLIAVSPWAEKRLRRSVGDMNPQASSNERFMSDESPFKDIQPVVAKFESPLDGVAEIDLGESSYLVSQQTITATGWRIYTLIDKQQVLAPLIAVARSGDQIGFVALICMLLMYSALVVYLRHMSESLSRRVALPIEDLSEATSQLSMHQQVIKLRQVGIHEVDQLSQNFVTMAEQLLLKTQELVASITREKERMKEAIEMERLAVTDPLTGLFNRLKIEAALRFECQRADRSGQSFGVILVDLDHFKNINDTYGHSVGDQVLVKAADLMRSTVRDLDIVGRWGGEEFMIICPLNHLEGTQKLAEVIRVRMAEFSFPLSERVTASFGVASYLYGESIDELVERADKALYQAKHQGRNQVAQGIPYLRSDDGAYL